MKNQCGRLFVWRVILLAAILLNAGSRSFGYGNLQFKDTQNDTVNSLWDIRSYDSPQFPVGIPWLLNVQGTHGSIPVTINELQNIVSCAFDTWENVPTSRIAFTYAGLTTNTASGDPNTNGHGLPPSVALDGDNVVSFEDLSSLGPGILAITTIFTLSDDFTFDDHDADPLNNTDFGGTDPNPDVPEGLYASGTILDADITVNSTETDWSVDGTYDKIDLQAVLVHEIGHWIGLCHSVIGAPYPAVMFPFAARNPEGLDQRTLKADDTAGVSFYYPSSTAGTTLGSISGTVRRQDNSNPVPAAHVVATSTADPSMAVGVYSNASGAYQIGALPPGDYRLYVEPLPKAAKARFIGDRINEIVLASHDVDFIPEFHDGVYREADSTSVSVAAGAAIGGLDFTVLDGDLADAFEEDDTAGGARALSTDGLREIHNIFPAGDVDLFEFIAQAGKEYLIQTAAWGEYGATYVTVTDPSGEIVAAEKADELDAWIAFQPPASGTYGIEVKHWTRETITSTQEGKGTHYLISILEKDPIVAHVDHSLGSDVTGDGSAVNPWATITHAIAAWTATPQSPISIYVAAGNYPEHIDLRRHTALYGGFGSSDWLRHVSVHPTFLDGGGTGNVVTLRDRTRIDGMTIQYGVRGVLIEGDLYGGPLAIVASCVVQNNWNVADFSCGGGIFLNNHANSALLRNVIQSNQARGGGGIYIFDSVPLVFRNLITGNLATEMFITNEGGGGIEISQPAYLYSAEVYENVILRNQAGRWGGGIHCFDSYYEAIRGNVVAMNNASCGGGVFTYDYYTHPQLRENTIVSNSASERGGGLYSDYKADPSLYRCALVGNSAVLEGGGICAHGTYNGPHLSLLNSLIMGNSAGTAGGVYWGESTRFGQFLQNVIGYNSGDGITIKHAGVVETGEVIVFLQIRNNIFTGNTGYGIRELEEDCDGDIHNNDFNTNGSGAYYDHDTAMGYTTAADINGDVHNGPYASTGGNADWGPGFITRPTGVSSAVFPDWVAHQSMLIDVQASFAPNSLVGCTINPNTSQPLHFFIIANTATTIVTWGDMTAVASAGSPYQVFDYHLVRESQNIDAGQDLSSFGGVNLDYDGNIRPVGLGFDIGAHEFPLVGSLCVTIAPQGAIDAGAQWRRAETTNWLDSNYTESGIPAGNRTVEFKDVSGWIKPGNVEVTISEGQTTNTSGTYLPAGSLCVRIFPLGAVDAGAQWRRVGTATWLDSAATESQISVGSYTVEFKSVAGWDSPANQDVTINNGQTTNISGTYTCKKPALARDWRTYR